jgi:hypothetical protein
VGLLAAFLSRRPWWAWLLLPAAPAAAALTLTGDADGALAGFLAVGITVVGALAFGRRWWPLYLLLASAVALVLLLAPDAYAAVGLLFLLLGLLGSGAVLVAGGAGRQRPERFAGDSGYFPIRDGQARTTLEATAG